MKIYVNEIPIKSDSCLFTKKVDYVSSYAFDGEKVNLYTYRCNLTKELCDLECGMKCNKLKVLC